MSGLRHVRTARLELRAITAGDIDELYALNSDPRVWTHLPSRVHTSRAQTVAQVVSAVAAWERDGLGYWTAWLADPGPGAGPGAGPDAGPDAGPVAGPGAGPDAGPDAGPVAGPGAGPDAGPGTGSRGTFAGVGGCAVSGGMVWNLYYRLQPDMQGRGLATELAEAGRDAALTVRPDLPITALLLEHNLASKAVAEKLGLRLAWRGPDAGNPSPDAIRLVYADRELTADVLGKILTGPG
jgi:RimJ/RimL family protein N-acetyltransferase